MHWKNRTCLGLIRTSRRAPRGSKRSPGRPVRGAMLPALGGTAGTGGSVRVGAHRQGCERRVEGHLARRRDGLGCGQHDDMAVLRHCGMRRVFGMRGVFAACYAPSPLGSFLRQCASRWAIRRGRFPRLIGLAGQAPLLPGVDQYALVDVDDSIIGVHRQDSDSRSMTKPVGGPGFSGGLLNGAFFRGKTPRATCDLVASVVADAVFTTTVPVTSADQ